MKEAGCILSNTAGKDPLEGLVMIDTLQRLGIDYHLREEIEAFLNTQYMNFSSPNHLPLDVFGVALRFRLLRQEGYNVSQGEQIRKQYIIITEILIIYLTLMFSWYVNLFCYMLKFDELKT